MGKDIRLWAKHRAGNTEATALDKARQLPNGHSPGTAKMPFPVADRDAYLKSIKGSGIAARTLDAPIVPVPLDKIWATQRTVNRERLDEHIRDPGMIKKGTRSANSGARIDAPIIVKKDGKLFCHDGHHRSTACWLKGQTSIMARLINLDSDGDENESNRKNGTK